MCVLTIEKRGFSNNKVFSPYYVVYYIAPLILLDMVRSSEQHGKLL